MHQNEVILHISDLHFSSKYNEVAQADRSLLLENLMETLNSLNVDWRPTIVCITGDIVDKADTRGFELASEWITNLSNTLDIKLGNFALCPGNHDCIRDNQICPTIAPQTRDNADSILTVPIPPYLEQRFRDYSTFCQNLGILPYRIGVYSSYLVGSREINGIQFVACNTAWFSFEENENSKLWLGQNYLRFLESNKQLVTSDSSADEKLSISLMHHGTETYFHELEKQVYNTNPSTLAYLWKRCHLALYGHSHESAIGDPDKMQAHCWRVRAGATNAGANHPNNINLIRLSDSGFELRYITYDPSGVNGNWNTENPVKSFHWVDAGIKQDVEIKIEKEKLEEKITILCEKVITYSEDIIQNKSRQLKPYGDLPEQISLDVIVKPESERIVKPIDQRIERHSQGILSLPLQEVIFKSRCTLLLGDLGAGKSTILAKLALSIGANAPKSIPIFIPANCLNISSDDNINEIINQLNLFIKDRLVLELPYAFEDVIKSGHEIVLLIDGLDEVDKTTALKLIRLLTKLPSHYSNVYVVLSSRLTEIAGIRYEKWQMCQVPSLDVNQKKTLLMNEAIVQGYDDIKALQFANDTIRKLQANPLLYTIANSPLAVRLLSSSFMKSNSVEATKTLGNLLYDLLLQRLGIWTESDLKKSSFEAMEKTLPTPEQKAIILGKLAFLSLNKEISFLEATEAISSSIKAQTDGQESLIARQVIEFFSVNGLITPYEPMRFIYQPLAQVAAGIYLAQEIINDRESVTEFELELWRVVSFASTMFRMQGNIEKGRTWINSYIKRLLKTRDGIAPACYIATELCDNSLAKEIVEEFPKIARRPLWYLEEERGESVQALAKVLILAEDLGFDWIFKEYLNPETPIINAGSALIQDLFRQWALLLKPIIKEYQKQKFIKLIKPLLTEPIGAFGFTQNIAYLVPEAFDLNQLLYLCSKMLDQDEFAQWAKDQIINAYSGNKEMVNTILTKCRNYRGSLLWLELNQDAKPNEQIVSNLISRSCDFNYDQIEDGIKECKRRIGNKEWLYLLRWFISDSDHDVAAAAALKLIAEDEDSFYLLGKALAGGLINKPMGTKCEAALRDLISKAKNTKTNWVSLLFNHEFKLISSSAGCWRIFLDNLLEGTNNGPELLVNNISHLESYNIPRYPDIRSKFRELMTGDQGREYVNALKKALEYYEPDIRQAAAMVLTACSPEDDGNALCSSIYFTNKNSDYWEWERFLLTLNYGISSLDTVKKSMLSFKDQERILALALLQANGFTLQSNEKIELVKAGCNWRSHFYDSIDLGECNLNTDFSFGVLRNELIFKSLKECSNIAQKLLQYHADKLNIQEQVKCYVAYLNNRIYPIQEIYNNLANNDFATNIKALYRETSPKEYPQLFRCFLNSDGDVEIKWSEILWINFCADERLDHHDVESLGLDLLWFVEDNPKFKETIGREALKLLDDGRIQKYRWTDSYYWLAILADQCIGLEKTKLKEIFTTGRTVHSSALYSLAYRIGDDMLDDINGKYKDTFPQNVVDNQEIFTAKDIQDELINAARDSERLKKGISDLITMTIINQVEISQEYLDMLATSGNNGCLLAGVLAYCYGLEIKADYAISFNDVYTSDEKRKSPDFSRMKTVSYLAHSQIMRLDNDAKTKYIEALIRGLDKEEYHKSYYIYEILRIQMEDLTIEQFCHLLSVFARIHGTWLDRNIVHFLSKQVIRLKDKDSEKQVLSIVSEGIEDLSRQSWEKTMSLHDASVFLFYSLTYGYLSDKEYDPNYHVFAHGIKLLFNNNENSEKQKHAIIDSIAILIESVPPETLRNLFFKLSDFPDAEVRAWIKLIGSFSFKE